MIGPLPTSQDGKKITAPISIYSPPEGVIELTKRIQQDYALGYQNQTKVLREFNDMSLLTRMETDQKVFNSYIEPKSDDPDEAWKWNGVRPIPRNKVISMAAHVTSTILFPGVFAQNENDEEDRQAGEVMGDLIEHK